jgi:large subunit ribosomal protein L37Ae
VDPSSNLGSPISYDIKREIAQFKSKRSKKKMPGSTKRFGSRYGRRIRNKVDAIETAQKAKYKCPYCHKVAAKRVAVGIWSCPKCSSTFTGKAYSLTKARISEETETATGALAQIKLREVKKEAAVQADEIGAIQAVPAEEADVVAEE